MGAKMTGLITIPNDNPSGSPLGQLTPTPTSDVRQTRQNINFKDMSPIEQGQTAEQQGLNPYMPLQMLQQQAQQASTQGPSAGPVPNTLMGPFTPPGVEAFPDDMAHLTTLMQQGLGPGAHPADHEMAMNARSIASARMAEAAAQATQAGGPAGGAQTPDMASAQTMNPTTPSPGLAPQLPPGTPQPPPGSSPMPGGIPLPQYPTPGVQPAAPIPTPQGAAPQDAMGNPQPQTTPPASPAQAPPTQAGAPGGIPPDVIASLLARHLKKGAAH